jgi:hypothetical protein
MKASVVGIVLCWLSATAFADIVSWQDENGVRHFTNLIEEVPATQREGAHVVVNEHARLAAVTPPANPEPPAPAPVGDRVRGEAEAVYDQAGAARAYLAGLRRGLEAARAGGGGGGSGGTVQINGPLAIARRQRGIRALWALRARLPAT